MQFVTGPQKGITTTILIPSSSSCLAILLLLFCNILFNSHRVKPCCRKISWRMSSSSCKCSVSVIFLALSSRVAIIDAFGAGWWKLWWDRYKFVCVAFLNMECPTVPSACQIISVSKPSIKKSATMEDRTESASTEQHLQIAHKTAYYTYNT